MSSKKRVTDRAWKFSINCSATQDLQISKVESSGDKIDGKGDNRPGFHALGYTSVPNELSLADQEGGTVNTVTIKTMERVAWATAQAPARSLFMTGFMLWMSGAGVHIFSIMITGMALLNPLKAILNTNKTFEQFNIPGINLTAQKLTFIAVQLVGLALGVWKLNKMGLLPLTSADWAASMLSLQTYEETSAMAL